MLSIRKGQVRLGDKDITGLTPQARVGEGMAFVPQTSNVFTGMTRRGKPRNGRLSCAADGIRR
jgi:ABC-type branched-subunit amino acid transport system ATPase component